MFVRKVRKKNDHISVRVVENSRQNDRIKQETLCCVGHAHKDDLKKIAHLLEVAEEMIPIIRNARQPVLPGFDKNVVYAPKKRKKTESVCAPSSYENLQEKKRLRLGIEDVFSREYEEMGLYGTVSGGYKKDSKNMLLKELVMARIDKPSSKRKSVENIERDRGEAFDLDSIYRLMDRIADREEWVKGKIARRTIGLFKEKIHVAFFDVTTLYFESFVPDELRVCGYSKDNKVKETQVVLAVMTTTDGLPLDYELYPGNTYEGGTLLASVEELRKKYEVVSATIVADRGMFSKKNLNELTEKEIDFVVSAKLKNMEAEMTDKILEDVEAAREEGLGDGWYGEYEYDGRRLVVGYSKKRAGKDRQDRKRLVERVEKKMKDGKVKVSDLVKNMGTKKISQIRREGEKEGDGGAGRGKNKEGREVGRDIRGVDEPRQVGDGRGGGFRQVQGAVAGGGGVQGEQA